MTTISVVGMLLSAMVLGTNNDHGFPFNINAINTVINGNLQPYTIIILFEALAYICISIDELGILLYTANLVIGKSQSYLRLFFSIYSVCCLLAIITSNDIVILTITPIIVELSIKLRVNVEPLLFVQFMAANTAGIMLIISNPTNVILGVGFDLNFNSYLSFMAIPATTAILSLAVALYILYFRIIETENISKSTSQSSQEQILSIEDDAKEDMPIQQKSKLLTFECLIPLFIFGSLTIVLILSPFLSLRLWVICAIFGGLMLISDVVLCLVIHKNINRVEKVLRRLPWSIAPFVLAMFIYVSGLEPILPQIAHAFAFVIAKSGIYGGTILAMVVSIGICNIINNQPMTILMVSILQNNSFKETLVAHSANPEKLFRAVLLASIVGSNIGANFTIIGSLAGIMWISLLKEKYNIHAIDSWKFFRVGVFCMVPVILLTSVAIATQTIISE